MVFCLVSGYTATAVSAATITDAEELALLYGSEFKEKAGTSIAKAGDVDADGFDDIIIGAPLHGDHAEGAVYLLYGDDGKIDSKDLNDVVQFYGEDSGDKLGSTVAGIGDINGDGFYDMAFTSLYHDTELRNPGTVYIVYGQSARFTDQSVDSLPTYTGSDDSARVGIALAPLGDINGDGIDDFAIGAPYRADRSGGVYIVYGSTEAYSGGTVASFVLLSGDDDFDYAGTAVAGEGDINGDGLADMIVSAPKHNTAERDTGMVYIIFGMTTQYTATALSSFATITGETKSERIGQAMALADLNADTLADIVIGAPYSDVGGENAGSVYIVYGSEGTWTTRSLNEAVRLHSTKSADSAGRSMAAYDFTGDGFADLIIGAPSTSAKQAGRVFLVPGASTMHSSESLFNFDRIAGETIGDQFGYAVAAAGDLNNDGSLETIVSAPAFGQKTENGGATYILYWPIPTCENSSAIGGILSHYPMTEWKHRIYAANDDLRIVVERKGKGGFLVNCKTDEIVQTLTFNTRAQRKILARVFRARGTSVFIVVTRTYSKRQIKVFFFRQDAEQLTELDYFTTKWRPRGLRIKLNRRNYVVLQKGKEKKHRIVYRITLDMKLQRL